MPSLKLYFHIAAYRAVGAQPPSAYTVPAPASGRRTPRSCRPYTPNTLVSRGARTRRRTPLSFQRASGIRERQIPALDRIATTATPVAATFPEISAVSVAKGLYSSPPRTIILADQGVPRPQRAPKSGCRTAP